jgi:hypothetical protein
VKSSPLPPLTASTMQPEHLDLRENAPSSIVCPDCGTWRHLKRRMIWPHRLDRTTNGGPTPRCPGSARLITLDITVEQWQAKLATSQTRLGNVDVDAGSRHGTRVKRQRSAETTPAVSRLVPGPVTAENVRRAYADHRAGCTACLGRRGCKDGERLADTYARLLRQEPRRRQVQARLDQSQRHRPPPRSPAAGQAGGRMGCRSAGRDAGRQAAHGHRAGPHRLPQSRPAPEAAAGHHLIRTLMNHHGPGRPIP